MQRPGGYKLEQEFQDLGGDSASPDGTVDPVGDLGLIQTDLPAGTVGWRLSGGEIVNVNRPGVARGGFATFRADSY